MSKPAHNRKKLAKQQFGKLFVTDRIKKISSKKLLWFCHCECGNDVWLSSNRLISGHTKSCGCLRHRIGGQNPKYEGYKDISKTYWFDIKNKAKYRNLEFNITIEEAWNLFIKQNKKCRFTGIKLYHAKSRKIRGTASFDRIDSSKGYTKENCQWIHKDINIMKNAKSDEEFIKLCHLVAAHNPLT